MTTPAPTPPEEMPFETALARLDQIVRDLESGSLSLETAMQRFEEGTRLTRLCRERLLHAEAKVVELLADGSTREIAIERK